MRDFLFAHRTEKRTADERGKSATADKSVQLTVFLSYAHEDLVQAQRLAAVLKQADYTVWWDTLIEGGTHFASSIEEALGAADAVIVIWSQRSVKSDWVLDEAAQGRDRHRLVPLSLDGTLPPLGFRQVQVIDISAWRGRLNSREINAIRRAVAKAAGQPTPDLPVVAKPMTRRAAIAVGGAAAVAGGGALAVWQAGTFKAIEAAPSSIAVLPFKNLNGDPGQAYLADGLTEEIRSALARNAGLLVLGATSSNTVGGDTRDAKSIARRLGVAYLLEGSVQRVGALVRVAANITSGETGFRVWSQSMDRQLDDIFALQNDLALIVANALSVQMATDAPAPGGTRNAEAYEAYLRGKSLYRLAKDEATDREAKANFELAISADPNFALAHAALSRLLASLAASNAEATELKSLYSAAIGEARRAIELAPTLAQGNLALGYALFAGRLDIRRAKPFYDKAYAYGRGDADIVLFYAVYTARSRRFDEARTAIYRALALDPLNPLAHRAAGTIAYASRDYADAVQRYRRALELNPAMSNAHAQMADALMELGQMEEARAAYAAEPKAMFRLRGQAVLEHRLGNHDAARTAFDQLVKEEGDAALYQQAEIMAQWGRADEAFAKLEKARAIGDSGLSAIATDPLLDPIAKDPRFIRLVREIGFA